MASTKNFNPTKAAADYAFGRRSRFRNTKATVNDAANTKAHVPRTTEIRLDDGLLRSRADCISTSIPQPASTWEAARQRNAAARGWAYLPPKAADVQPNATCETFRDPDGAIRVDIELFKVSGIGLKQFPQLQRWTALHERARLTGRQGFTRAEFDAALAEYGVKGCAAYNTRLLRRGNGFFWNLHGGMIYPVGYTELVERVIQRAHDYGKQDLYLYGNHPGQRRDMYISIAGSAADFEAAILKAWYAAHGNPTISRYTLSILLGRDARSIRRMERRAGIEIVYNEAETTDPAAVPLNADGDLRGDVRYEAGVYHFRMANTYKSSVVRQHPHRGQGRKAACWFKHWLSEHLLPDSSEVGVSDNFRHPGKLNRVFRTYCETDKALRASRKRGNVGVLYVPAKPRQGRGLVWNVSMAPTQNI